MGKGSRYRPVNQERYGRNYDQIFSKRTKQPMSVQTFDEFEDRCLSTWREFPTGMCPHMFIVLAINGEAGELAEEVKKMHRDMHGNMDISRRDRMALELGDILYYSNLEAHHLGFTLQQIADMNVEKLAARRLEGGY